jgi:NAD+ diphosphatase
MAPLRQLMVAGDEEGAFASQDGPAARHLSPHPSLLRRVRRPHDQGRGVGTGCHHGHVVYPRISPCIISGGAQAAILLAAHRRHYQAEDPMYTVLAGFVEAGRTWSSAWRGRCSRRAASG